LPLRPRLDRGADTARGDRCAGRRAYPLTGTDRSRRAWFEPGRFIEALAKKAVDIVQPDVSHAGGLAETKRIAHLAQAHMIPVAPHNPVGPVMNAMTLHLSVAIPNFSVFETAVDVPWRKELVRETLAFDDGAVLAPTAPGLGVELIEEACARFPYEPYNVPLFDGSMNTSGVATGAETFGKR
jgi:galactonate dehydratase